MGGILDANCLNFSGNACVTCFQGYYVSEGKCKQVNPLCKTFDSNSGFCTSCYPGYAIAQGECQVNQAKDTNCKTSDSTNPSFCLQCYSGYISINGRCSVQNPLCKTIDNANGNCLSCWQGYSLVQGNCAIGTTPDSPSSVTQDIYCITLVNGLCTRCSNGFFLSKGTGKCTQLNPLCKTSDSDNGACLSCYQGYALSSGNCVVPAQVFIANCAVTSASGMCS